MVDSDIKEGPKSGRSVYTLLDHGFFYGLGTLSKLFRERNLNTALYGGTGFQAQLCREIAGNRSIDNHSELVKMLRPTGDFDIAIPGGVELQPSFLDEIEGEEIVGDDIYTTRLDRRGGKRSYVNVRKMSTNEEFDFYVTFHNDDPFHQNMVSERKDVDLNLGELKARVSLAPLEYTIAGKLARAGIHRDIPDLVTALEIFPNLDMDKIVEILKGRLDKESHLTDMISMVRRGKDNLLDYLKQFQK